MIIFLNKKNGVYRHVKLQWGKKASAKWDSAFIDGGSCLPAANLSAA